MIRTWIFGTPTAFTLEQKEVVNAKLNKFIPDWNAHGNALTAGFEILENHFIRVWVNESLAAASGCSIDALTHIIQDIEKEMGLNLMDRMQIFYKSNKVIKTLPLYTFKQQVKEMAHNDTFVYQLSVSTGTDFEKEFCVPLSKSWASKYL